MQDVRFRRLKGCGVRANQRLGLRWVSGFRGDFGVGRTGNINMNSTRGCLVGVLLLSVACVCMTTFAKVFSTVRVLGPGS